MKMKMIVLTAIMTLSFSVVTEAATLSETEQELEISSSSEILRSNLFDIPFIDILEITPLFYPPLDC